MALTHQDTAVNQLIINRLTKQEFDNLPSYSNTELYIVPEQLDSVVTQNSTNPVQSGAVYEAIQNVQNLTADDGIDITNNVISTKIDNDTIQFNSNGEMYCANAGSLKQVDCSTYRGVAGEIVQHIGYDNTSLNLINGHIYKLGTEQRTRLVVSENDFIQAGNYDYVGPYPSSISTSIYSDYGMDHYTWVTNKPFANLAVGDLFWKLPYNDTDYHNVAEVQRVAHIAESSVVLDNGIVLYSLSQLHQFSVNLAEGYSDGNIILFKNQDDYFLGGLFIPINSYITETTYDVLVWQPIGVQSYNDLSDKPLSVESSKVKYTLSNGTTKLTLAQEGDLKEVAFSGSYNDLTDKLQNATTSAAGLMSASDKTLLGHYNIIYTYSNAGLSPGLTDAFLKKFIDYIKQNYAGNVVMGVLQPSFIGCFYGYSYNDANYSSFLLIHWGGIVFFGENNGTFYRKTVTTS